MNPTFTTGMDKEIDEILAGVISQTQGTPGGTWVRDLLAAKYAAQKIREMVLAARIAEAKLPMFGYGIGYSMPKALKDEIVPYTKKRIAELQAQQKGADQ